MQGKGRFETQVGLFVLGAIAIFIYMGFQIGAFRFDRERYSPYIIYFKDISGLARKAEVKIAGVKVGWVEAIRPLPNEELMKAEADVMVLKDYVLHEDAYAVVRQDGLLGPKFLEIVPGDPLLIKIEPGQALGKPSVSPVSVDDILHKVKHIATNVESVSDSLKKTMGGDEGREQLQTIFNNLETASQRLSSFANVLERAFVNNEENLDAILEIGANVRGIASKLEHEVLPSVQGSVENISGVFDRDFERVADRLSDTSKALEDASLQARESFANLTSVTEKLDEGKGLLGKLINEDETYRDLKIAIGGLKNYFMMVNRMELVFDAHGEAMHRPASDYHFEDSKFYFDVRLHPNEDVFYMLNIVTSERGWRSEHEVIKTYLSDDNIKVDTDALRLTDDNRIENVFRKRETILTRNTLRLGLQFGKIFTNIAVRAGLFEGTGGLGIDFNIPLNTDNLRWVTTLEVFDITGWNRFPRDRRPHVKWLNKMYFMRNIYFAFGADDFVSRHNANAFFGAGLRFSDDDIKYLLPSLGGARGLAT